MEIETVILTHVDSERQGAHIFCLFFPCSKYSDVSV